MDISFALQALAVEDLARAATLAPGVHPVPGRRSTARSRALKLASLGVEIDALSAEQEQYLRGWR